MKIFRTELKKLLSGRIFLLIAAVVFAIVKAMNAAKDKLEHQEAEAPAAPPEPSKEEVLLTEIRDLLAEKK